MRIIQLLILMKFTFNLAYIHRNLYNSIAFTVSLNIKISLFIHFNIILNFTLRVGNDSLEREELDNIELEVSLKKLKF